MATSCSNDFINDYQNVETDIADNSIENTVLYKQNPEFSCSNPDKHDDSFFTAIDYMEETYVVQSENDEYLYMEFSGVPYRYSKTDGVLTCFCTDPMCDHTQTSCPFGGNIGNCKYYNGKIYYSLMNFDGGDNDKNFVSYDIANNSLKVLREGFFGYNIAQQVFYDNYCYFYDVNVDKETNEWTVFLKRQNIYTNEIELCEVTEGYTTMMLFGNKDRLYFRDFAYGNIYYSPINDFSKKVVIFNYKTDHYILGEDKLFFVQYFIDGSSTLASISYDGTNYIDYQIADIGSYFITDKYIYYMTDETSEIEIGQDCFSINSRYLNRYNFENGDKERIISLDDVLKTISIRQFIVDRNYIYAAFDYYHDDISYNTCGNSILRIDVNSGEWYYIDPNYLRKEK